MSRIPEIKDLKNIPKVLNPYIQELGGFEDLMRIERKTIAQVNKEQAQFYYYLERRTELSTLVSYVEGVLLSVKSRLFKGYTEQYQRELGDNAKLRYIEGHTDYITVKEFLLEVAEVRSKYDDAVDAFRTRGFAINNLTKASVAEVENNLL